MDDKKTLREPERRRKRAENPLMQEEKSVRRRDRKSEGMRMPERSREPEKASEKEPNAYKLLILKIILVVLVVALIAAFVFEIGFDDQKEEKNLQNAPQTQTEELISQSKAEQPETGNGDQNAETESPETEVRQ